MLAMLLPPVLVRHMEPATYAVWVLVLQFVAYLSYLDFGLQTAIGRYVAFATEKNDMEWRDAIFSTALSGLAIAASVGVILIISAALAAHLIFPSIPSQLLGPMRAAMLIVGFSVAVGLPSSAWNGVFVGFQRYEIPAFTIGGGKLLAAIGLVVVALTGKSIVLMATVVAAANFSAYIAQFIIRQRIAPDIHFRRELITRPVIRELSGYCLSLTVWSVSMILVNGFDLILVGRFQFSAVIPYAVSATFIMFMAGLQSAIFGVMVPHAAGLQARENSKELGSLLVSSTKLGVLLLLLTGLPLITFAHSIIGIWIGKQFAESGGAILTVLMIANMLRLTAAPYASILVGTGQQRLVIVSPFMEGITNLCFSLLLGMKYGAIGVAWGTLIGAFVGVLANLFYNLPRTRKCIDVSRRRYVFESLVVPVLCGIPVCLAIFAASFSKTGGSTITVLGLSLSCLACVALLFKGASRELGNETAFSSRRLGLRFGKKYQ